MKWYEYLIAFLIIAICLAAGFGILWLIIKAVYTALLFLIGLIFVRC